jgi:hypothetical protein
VNHLRFVAAESALGPRHSVLGAAFWPQPKKGGCRRTHRSRCAGQVFAAERHCVMRPATAPLAAGPACKRTHKVSCLPPQPPARGAGSRPCLFGEYPTGPAKEMACPAIPASRSCSTALAQWTLSQMIWVRSNPNPWDLSFLPTILNSRWFGPSANSSVPMSSPRAACLLSA